MRPFAIVLALGLALARNAGADEPPIAPPPPAVPAPEPAPPPILGEVTPPPPALPAGVTPIQDARTVTFVLSGGNRVVARRIGEDPEYVWVEADGRQARIRKTDIASMDFQGGAAPAPPVAPSTGPPPSLHQYYAPPPPAPKGRGMVIWGGIMLGVGYTLAIAAATNESTGTDGSSILLAIPLVGPFFFAGTDAAEGEPMIWILDGLMQIGGLGLLYFGIRRLSEQPDRPDPRTPRVGLSVGRHGAFAQATWTL